MFDFFLLKLAPFFKSCWSWQHLQICHFSSFRVSICSCYSILFVSQVLWNIWQKFSTLFFCGYSGFEITHFFFEITRPMNWPDKITCISHAQSFVVVPFLLPVVFTVMSYPNFLTHRSPQFQLKNLCFLVALAVSSLLFVARTQPSLNLLLSRIGRFENPFRSA